MPPPHPPLAAQGAPAAVTRWRLGLPDTTAGHWLAALLFVALPFIAANILTKLLLPDAGLRDLRNLIKCVVLVAGYWACVHWHERRPVRELAWAGALPEVLAGLLLGGGLFAAVAAALAGLGAYSIDAAGSLATLGSVVVAMLPKMLAGALIEEMLFRLLALRLLERSLGSAWALALSSLLFGLAHGGNAGASPLVSAMLGAGAGLLLGAAWLLTRRVWLCTAVHLAWNFAQGAVFSMAVSGQTGEGWLHGRLTGPTWLTGGAFGAEGSVVALALCLAAAAVLLVLAHRRGQFRRAG